MRESGHLVGSEGARGCQRIAEQLSGDLQIESTTAQRTWLVAEMASALPDGLARYNCLRCAVATGAANSVARADPGDGVEEMPTPLLSQGN